MNRFQQDSDKSTLIVGITGGSGVGKTTIARSIAAKLNSIDVVIIQQDSYYRDRGRLPEPERESINYDSPSAFDTQLLAEHLADLKNNRSVKKPVYDFTIHARKVETVTIHPARVVILEGVLILENKKLKDLIDFKIFVDAGPDIRFIRRLQRDIKERGRALDSVIMQYLDTVRPMHLKFVEKAKRHADIVISGEGDNQKDIEDIVSCIKLMLK